MMSSTCYVGCRVQRKPPTFLPPIELWTTGVVVEYNGLNEFVGFTPRPHWLFVRSDIDNIIWHTPMSCIIFLPESE